MILFCLFSSFSCYKNDICPEADSLILEEAMVRGGGHGRAGHSKAGHRRVDHGRGYGRGHGWALVGVSCYIAILLNLEKDCKFEIIVNALINVKLRHTCFKFV